MKKNAVLKVNSSTGRNYLEIESHLERVDGTYTTFRFPLQPNGQVKGVVFCDVNGTYVWLLSILREAISIVFPWVPDVDELLKVYLAGFKLGTSWREFYRMYGIYVLKMKTWKDPLVYENDFVKLHEHEIDQPGSSYYQIADRFLTQFDYVASGVVRRQYEENPQHFAGMKIKPINRLAELLLRSGYVVVGMSANPRRYIQAICKYMGLADFFIDCATDSDIFGRKEYKMEYLRKWLHERGIEVPLDRIMVVGDSITGDLGSALRFKWLVDGQGGGSKVDAYGLLVVKDEDEFNEACTKIALDPELQTLVRTFRMDAIRLDLVTTSNHGTPNLASRYRKTFLQRLTSSPAT